MAIKRHWPILILGSIIGWSHLSVWYFGAACHRGHWFFTKGVIAQQIMGFFEGIIEKAPGLNFIFGTTKDMTEAFVGEKKKFTKPVVVEISEGVYKIGFLTQEDMTAVGLPNCCAVYLPYSYTLSGETTVVEKSRVRRIEKESGDVTKFVLSGGATNLK